MRFVQIVAYLAENCPMFQMVFTRRVEYFLIAEKCGRWLFFVGKDVLQAGNRKRDDHV